MLIAARRLITLSSVVFIGVGLAYLVVPGSMLAVVGILSAPTNDFLMRTEGVALLAGGILLWTARTAAGPAAVTALGALAIYYILGSAVDLAAFAQGIVGPAAVPSGIVRTVIGLACAWVAWRLRADHAGAAPS